MVFDPDRLIGLTWSVVRQDALAYVMEAELRGVGPAIEAYSHPAWEIRYFAVSVPGKLACRDSGALTYLFDRCGVDPSWQIHEALAMGFDDYCSKIGYEEAVPEMLRWIQSPHPSVRRAVSEGLRPWTASKRLFFARHPQIAIDLLAMLNDDDSRSVQESVGNAMRDISREHFDLVLDALQTWIAASPDAPSRRLIARFALRNAVKEQPSLKAVYE
jgi:3-methyladenine DNA glycosylase AlkC